MAQGNVEQPLLLPQDVASAQLHEHVRVARLKHETPGERQLNRDQRQAQVLPEGPIVSQFVLISRWIEERCDRPKHRLDGATSVASHRCCHFGLPTVYSGGIGPPPAARRDQRASRRSTCPRSEKFASIRRRAAPPISALSRGFAISRPIASAIASASLGGVSKPVTPSSISSGMPPTRVATAGTAHAPASMRLTGIPSLALESTATDARRSH